MEPVPNLPLNGWRFCSLRTESGRDRIEDWFKGEVPIGEAKGVREYLLESLRNLRFLRMELWKMPQFQWFQGAHDGIGEIRFSYRKVEYRFLGCLGPEPDQFTLVAGASKRSNSEWSPRNVRDSAAERMKFLGGHSEDINAIEIPN